MKISGFVTALLMASALTPCALHAQQAAPVDADTDSDVIIVTAQKREERLQDVPMTVSVVQTDSLLRSNRTSFTDYLTQVPGISFQSSSPGRTVIAIRGISSPNGNPLVGFTIDDVPFGASTYLALGSDMRPDLDPADLDRIEILQGPQGTLYGASSMGGLVKYVTSSPNLDEVKGRIQMDGSSVEHGSLGYGVRGSIDVPVVTGSAGIKLSGFYRKDPGFIDDPAQGVRNINDSRTYGGRLGFAANLTDDLTLKAGALYQKTTGDGTARVDLTYTFDPAAPAGSLDGVSVAPLVGPYARSRVPGTDTYRTTVQFYDVALEQDLGGATLTSLTGYANVKHRNLQDYSIQFSAFGLFPPGTGIGFGEQSRSKKFTQEIRLGSTGDQRLFYTLGLFYTHEKNYLAQSIGALDPTTGASLPALGGLFFPIPQKYEEYAAFASIGYKFTDTFDIEAGARVSHNKQSFSEDPTLAPSKSSETPVTFSITPRWKVTPDTMIYARVATGYRPGGPTTSPPPGVPFEFGSDKTVNYEAGIKTTLLDNKLIFNSTLYYIDWKDIQVSVTDPNTGFSYYSNGPRADVKGAQFDLTYRPVGGLTLTAALAYTDAAFSRDTDPTSSVYGLKGDRLPYVSKWATTWSADYHWDLSDDFHPYLGASLAYVGKRKTSFVGSATEPRPGLASYTRSTSSRCRFRQLFAGLLCEECRGRARLYRSQSDHRGPLFAHVDQPEDDRHFAFRQFLILSMFKGRVERTRPLSDPFNQFGAWARISTAAESQILSGR